MIIFNNNSIDIIQGSSYGDGVTDWRIENTSGGVFNILNNTSSTPCISIIENGNVGFGTTPSPTSSKLEVIGDINTGYYNSRGVNFFDTSNYVLSTSNILVPRILTEINRSPTQWTNISTGIYYYPTIVKSLPNIITSSPAATINDIVSTDRYMSFTYTTDTIANSGQTRYTITVPAQGIICDILIVAGGGGASFNAGGGAGGLIYLSNQKINSGSYNIYVGNGGIGGSNGYNSSFDTYIAIGGGRGAYVDINGGNGGSGGGGISYYDDGLYTTDFGYGIPGQGNNGGVGGSIWGAGGAGGGGAGGVGGSNNNNNGGIGLQYSITGTPTYYAGGGGGSDYFHDGSGGLGGGGRSIIVSGSGNNNGESNTGGGGGSGQGVGGNGGSGIVIIRYRKLLMTTVGIGIANPISKLHLYDDNISETKLTIQNNCIGNIITNSTDRYIIFTSGSSSFTISSGGVNCDILMIGGGGGGSLGGGGAGSCIVAINQTLAEGICSVVVGAGGIGGTSATNGGDSSITVKSEIKYLAKGGSYGGYNSQVPVGGCGGGGGYNPTNHTGGNISTLNIVNGISNISPSVTSSYAVFGTKGGDVTGAAIAVNEGYGGGGGIGSVGGNFSGGLVSGLGGDGLYQATINTTPTPTTINFRSYFANNTTFGVQDGTTGNYYIGGGGGGASYYKVNSSAGSGGRGGGGNGGDVKIPIDGVVGQPNTGSGGGGANPASSVYANGGSGIVIIRYRATTSRITVNGNSSIELIRGTENDANRDYKIGNYNGDFIIKSSLNYIDSDYIKITGSTAAITNPTGTTSWTSASDKRIKENIERASYDKCYESINKLELNRFNYINGFNTVNKDITQLGFIAQEVKEIFPKAIFLQEFHNDTLNIPDLHLLDVSQINYSLYGTVKKLIEKVNNNVKKIEKIENILNIDNNIILTSNITSNLMSN